MSPNDPLPPELRAAEASLLLPGEDTDVSRRAFLRLTGFGLTAGALSSCSRAPLRHVVPNLLAPVGTVAGRAYWLATTCAGCSAACGVLAKCRDGRPIKLEGNETHALSRGGLCAVGQAEVLSLYDSRRFTAPQRATDSGGFEATTWSEADAFVAARLDAARASGGAVRLLTGSLHGPAQQAALEAFLEVNPNARHVAYDALSVSALLDAHGLTRGVRALPSFRFDKAEVIASFEADFLGTWISPVAFAAAYAEGRRPDREEGWMSRHVQLEARVSLTGTVADRRLRVAPDDVPAQLFALCRALETRAGAGGRLDGEVEAAPWVEELADELWRARGQALVVCGQNDLQAQLHTAYANELLGAYGRTLSVARPSNQMRGDDRALANLRAELEAGSVELLITSGVNPAYDLPPDVVTAIERAGTHVAHAASLDETVGLADLVLPRPHALEAWGDGEPEVGRWSLTQPALPALRQTRSLARLLASWIGDAREDYDLLRDAWRAHVHPRVAAGEDFQAFFDRALHDGFVQEARQPAEPAFDGAALGAAPTGAAAGGLTLVLHANLAQLDGRHAHNPWLQELPDPITKVTWDNWASLSPARAEQLGLEDGDLVRLVAAEGGPELVLPTLVQRGQHDDVVAVALGYGRIGTDRFAKVGPQWLEGQPTIERGETIGANAALLSELRDGALRHQRGGLRVEAAGGRVDLASTQDHHSLEVPPHVAPEGGEVRNAVRAATFADFQHDPEHALAHGHHLPEAELWPDDHANDGPRWGMSVDLTRCIGCSACAVGCQAENNVPVVGKDEVLRHREMSWMRIDRYFTGGEDDLGAAHQPMFCQQCDHAPCEAVCPVLATVHSTDGLNQQVYNRCVGTRYCANTCPYKVRRFNWFDYPHEDELENQALNPDVTVRTRGVMEKCSFCAQRIQEARSEAVRKGVPLADGDIRVACQQSCPTRAIVFGDLNDPESEVSKLAHRQRSYRVLEELNVKPSVHYLARITNPPSDGHASPEAGHHDG